MPLYIRNNHYYYKKQIDGKAYYKTLKLKKGQESLLSARLKQVEEEVLARHFGIPYMSSEQITFVEYVKKYLKQKSYKKSLKADISRLNVISECFGNINLAFISKPHIQKLEEFLVSRKVKFATINRYFGTLNHLFNLAIDDGYIKENPIKFYKPFIEEGIARALEDREIACLLEVSRKIQDNPKTYVQAIIYDLIFFALLTGMRLSEIIKLKKSYIRNDIISYPITETKYSRRGISQQKVKIICLNKTALNIIKSQSSKSEYVFDIKRRHPGFIRKIVAQLRSLTEITDLNFHQLRHTASTIVSASTGIFTAKAILGHKDIKTTLRYSHPQLKQQREGVAKLEEYIFDITHK